MLSDLVIFIMLQVIGSSCCFITEVMAVGKEEVMEGVMVEETVVGTGAAMAEVKVAVTACEQK